MAPVLDPTTHAPRRRSAGLQSAQERPAQTREQNDRIDARKLANLLPLDNLEPVYHGETSVRILRELARSYLTIVKDLTRVMNRLKAVYCSWAIPWAGRDVHKTMLYA